MTRLTFTYKNHRNEIAPRTIEVTSLDYVPLPNNDYGYGPGWFLTGYDFTGERQGQEVRSFALCNIQMPEAAFRRMSNNHPFRLDLTSPELKAHLVEELRKAGHDIQDTREEGEFGDGVRARSYEDQGTAHDPHAGAHEVQGRRSAVDEILKK